MSILGLNGRQTYKFIGTFAVLLILLSFQILVKADVVKFNAEPYYIEPEELPETIDIGELNVANDYLYTIEGIASYYAQRFHNRKTANGERFDMHGFTAAHKTLPFGTILRVTNTVNGKNVLVRINDRGPFVGRRIIDLSYKSAKVIDGISVGVPKVKIEGFIPNKFELPSDQNSNFYLAYSFNREPICINSEYVNISDTTEDFTEAVKLLMEMNDKEGSDEYFIFTDAAEYTKSNTFFIGIADTDKITNSVSIVRF